jgi:hypothetical protein
VPYLGESTQHDAFVAFINILLRRLQSDREGKRTRDGRRSVAGGKGRGAGGARQHAARGATGIGNAPTAL